MTMVTLEEGVLTILDAVRALGADDLRAYRALGAIGVTRQDEMLLFNYTKRATYAGAWTPVERASRGLMVHWPSVTLAALPFPKFFNLGERPETTLANLPPGACEITEKLDGSLGVLYRAADGLAVATRGSFASDQALWATRHLRAHAARHDLSELPDDLTLLFEIIYPDNRDGPVLRYADREGLFIIGARRFDGSDLAYAELLALGDAFGFPVTPRFAADSLEALTPLIATATGVEGWVARFANGLRVKIKTSDYLRLHRLVSQVTPGRIHELLLNAPETLEERIMDLPDEFQREAQAIADAMLRAVTSDEARLRAIFDGPLAPYVADSAAANVSGDRVAIAAARKAFALAIPGDSRADASLLFALLDGRDLHALLMKRLDLATLFGDRADWFERGDEG